MLTDKQKEQNSDKQVCMFPCRKKHSVTSYLIHCYFNYFNLQGKRGIEKPPFDLPEFIKKTGIMEMRAALQEKEEAKGKLTI